MTKFNWLLLVGLSVLIAKPVLACEPVVPFMQVMEPTLTLSRSIIVLKARTARRSKGYIRNHRFSSWISSCSRSSASKTDEAQRLRDSRFAIDPQRTYSLAELIDLAESHKPETRVSWERARAQAAALGVARSELYPALAAAALSQTTRSETYLTNRFYRQTIQDFDVQLQLNYTIFDCECVKRVTSDRT